MDIFVLVTAIAGAVAAAIYLGRVAFRVYRCAGKLEKFIDDWYGDEHKPGILVRVERIERHVGIPVGDAPR